MTRQLTGGCHKQVSLRSPQFRFQIIFDRSPLFFVSFQIANLLSQLLDVALCEFQLFDRVQRAPFLSARLSLQLSTFSRFQQRLCKTRKHS